MIELSGSYLLKLKFGDSIVPLSPSEIEEFTIIQDLYKLLPSFRLRLVDAQGIFTHILPFDKDMSRISVDIGRASQDKSVNSFDFVVFRRFPEGNFGASSYYDIDGLLDVPKLFSPDYNRSWKKPVKTILEDIAFDELDVNQVEVSQTLNYEKVVIQPGITNIQLFNELTSSLLGKNDNASFCCFIKQKNMRSVFTFKSLYEFSMSEPKYKFVVNDNPYEDFFPIYDYFIYDNYRLLNTFGSKKQNFGYFDYFNSEYISSSLLLDEIFSLTDYFLVDRHDTEDSVSVDDLGRNNDFCDNFKGKILSGYYKRIMDLTKMWITTWGLENIVPGDIVDVLFPQGINTGDLASYQYNGYWLVERVVHTIGDTFRTKLLLTRNGINTGHDTTLVKASKRKK